MLSERKAKTPQLLPYNLLFVFISAPCLSISCLPSLPHFLSASSSFSVSAMHDREFLLEAPLWLLAALLSSQDEWWSYMSDRFTSILPETF